MFTAGMMESREHRVNINEVEAEEFGLLLDFAYTSTVEISTANVQVFIIFILGLSICPDMDKCVCLWDFLFYFILLYSYFLIILLSAHYYYYNPLYP